MKIERRIADLEERIGTGHRMIVMWGDETEAEAIARDEAEHGPARSYQIFRVVYVKAGAPRGATLQ